MTSSEPTSSSTCTHRSSRSATLCAQPSQATTSAAPASSSCHGASPASASAAVAIASTRRCPPRLCSRTSASTRASASSKTIAPGPSPGGATGRSSGSVRSASASTIGRADDRSFVAVITHGARAVTGGVRAGTDGISAPAQAWSAGARRRWHEAARQALRAQRADVERAARGPGPQQLGQQTRFVLGGDRARASRA